jgi:hypothetical protein
MWPLPPCFLPAHSSCYVWVSTSVCGIRKRSGSEGIGGLATLEGAIFGLMGLLLAFTISGALQRFGDRRQLVIREATAATTAYGRLSLSVSMPAGKEATKAP